jgi:Cu(I)/Ag(I) efflux system membrane fusion protein
MTKRFRPVVIVLVLVVIIEALGLGLYAFRDRLGRIPYIGRPGKTTTISSTSAANPTASADKSQDNTGTARGEVTIDPRRQQLIGVRTVEAKREVIAPTIRAVGTVRYDERRLAEINLKLEGWIRDLYVDFTGQPIAKGQPLFTLYSPDLLNTEYEYLLAMKTRDQMQQSMIPDARERADQLVTAARQRLTLWDLPAEEIRALEERRQAHDAVVFRSPVTGFVLEKQALAGMHVMPGQTLYKIADLSVVWIEADLYETELPLVRVGQRATVTLDAYPDEQFTGRVIYIYPFVDEKTRTNKVRYEFVNRGGRLKPGMYANVEITGSAGSAIVVPANAVLDSGKEQVVFVSKGDGYFEPRRVKIGRRFDDRIQIVDGVKEGEQVATSATFLLDSESQLRASLQGFETPQGQTSGAEAKQQLEITLRSQPDPPKTGENQLEVVVKDATGKPIDGAEVAVQFFMAAMPTMNMPPMRNEVKLTPAGGGVYRGTGQVMMAGRWDTTVTVTRGGQRIGAKQLAVVAR